MEKIINLLVKMAYDKNETIIIYMDLFEDIDNLGELSFMLQSVAITIENGESFKIIKPVSYIEQNDEQSVRIQLSTEFINFINGKL